MTGIHIPASNFSLSDIDIDKLLVMGIPAGGFPLPMNDSIFNASLSEEDIARVLSKPLSIFDEVTQICLIVAFAVLILFGACGNGLVCYVVAKNPNMRTPRNIFIINLAISDMTLCCFTQPFNLMKVNIKHGHFSGFNSSDNERFFSNMFFLVYRHIQTYKYTYIHVYIYIYIYICVCVCDRSTFSGVAQVH